MLPLEDELDLDTELLDSLRSFIPCVTCPHLTSGRGGDLTHLF